MDAGRRGSRLVQIAIEVEASMVPDDVDPVELGIREIVGAATSRYAGSSTGRIHNISLSTARYDGLLIPPDSTFSFNEHLGEVTEAEGYERTLIILDGATADGVGGGVCQVSTTLFRAAFWAGLPIIERHAHGYRVAYYEQGEPPGFDATIYSPIVDLKVHNDTGHWLLIEATVNKAARTATFTLYGTRPDREVEMGPVLRGKSVPPPPPRVEVDPNMPAGTSETVELARDGLSVTITRIIREAGEERRENFHSTYRPTGQVTAVGPPLVARESGPELSSP
jgi:vancomycin resistance protein YoaR